MEEKIKSIQPQRSKERLEVRTKKHGKIYYLWPKFRNHFYIVESIADTQCDSDNQPVPARQIQLFVEEAKRPPPNMRPYKRGEYSLIRDLDKFYVYWYQRFRWVDKTRPKWWTVTEKDKKKEVVVSDDKTAEILKAVFQHDGTGEEAMYWLGDIPEVQVLPDEVEPMGQTKAKTAQDAKQNWKRLREYCSQLVKSSVSRLADKYDSDLFVARQKAKGLFNDFLKSDKNLFLILGKSGRGKTNLICHLAETIRVPSLFFSGEMYRVGRFCLERQIEQALRPLLLNNRKTTDSLMWVNDLAEKNHTSFIIYVDALNEFANAALVLQELTALVSRYGAIYPAIKFCVTCRTPAWENLTKTVKAALPQHNLYRSTSSGLVPPDFSLPAAASITLGDFSEEELPSATEKYRDRWGFKGELSKAAKRLCRYPLLMRLVAQTWAGKKIPKRVDSRVLWDTYWNATVASGPKGTQTFALETACAMRTSRTREISKGQACQLPSYSEKRLNYLVEAGVLSLQDRKYECQISFTYERLFEYALGRVILSQMNEVLAELPKFLEEAAFFFPVENAFCFIAEMVDERVRWRLLNQLSTTIGTKGKELACKVIKELNLTSNAAWDILESISGKNPIRVAYAIAEIGASQPERAKEIVTRMIRDAPYWKWGIRNFPNILEETLIKLCKKSGFFVRTCEQYLTLGSRYKQISLRTLCQIDGYDGWATLADAIARFSSSSDGELRQVAASSIRYVEEHDSKIARGLVVRLANDSKSKVRHSAGWCLGSMVIEKHQWLQIVKTLAESGDWHARQMSATAVGLVLSDSGAAEVARLAKTLSVDPQRKVRMSLARALVCSRLPPKKFRSAVLPLLEAVIRRCTHKEVVNLSDPFDFVTVHGPKLPNMMRAELMQRWSHSKSPKFREFAARIWKSKLKEGGMDKALHFVTDRSSRVRIAFARTVPLFLMQRRWKEQHSIRGLLDVTRKFLDDREPDVRAAGCVILQWLACRESDECIRLLLDQMAKDKSTEVKRLAFEILLGLDAEELPEVSFAMQECIGHLPCKRPLTKLGKNLGGWACGREPALELLCRITEKQAEPYQQVAAAALPFYWLHDRAKAKRYIKALSKMIRLRDSRSHLIAFAKIVAGISKAEVKLIEPLKIYLSDLDELLQAGFGSRNDSVRWWTVVAAWWCLGFSYPSLGQCAENILNKAKGDYEPRLRFACALYGGALLSQEYRAAIKPVLDLLSSLCICLLEDKDDLVKCAAAFSIAQLPNSRRSELLQRQLGGAAADHAKAVVEPYLKGSARQHLEMLLARFYSLAFDWASQKLEYEVDVLDEDKSNLLIAVWREKPEETESLAKMWLKQDSQGLRDTARKFFRKLKKIRSEAKTVGEMAK